MSWNMVNMDLKRSPNSSCTSGSSIRSESLPISSVAAIANMYRIKTVMTQVQSRGRADVVRPWMRIHSSLNIGISRTARAKRAKRSARKTVKTRMKPTSKPIGSANHLMKTPVPKTRHESAKLTHSKNHTQPKARIRKHHSTKKNIVKMCSKKLKMPEASPSGREACQPIRTQFSAMTKATETSKFILATRLLISGWGFW
mmetsp:Transcript_15087/g.31569  ORF Transcript_15087/g.31569 Transcript_15087/m.31569 type:complete len:200 (+) Transcript_15087:864-1463(+)